MTSPTHHGQDAGSLARDRRSLFVALGLHAVNFARRADLHQGGHGACGGDVAQIPLLLLLPFLPGVFGRARAVTIEPVDGRPLAPLAFVDAGQRQHARNIILKYPPDAVNNSINAVLAALAAIVDHHLQSVYLIGD